MHIVRGLCAIMWQINDDDDDYDDDIAGRQCRPSKLAVYRGINCRLCSRTDDGMHGTMCDRVGIVAVIIRHHAVCTGSSAILRNYVSWRVTSYAGNVGRTRRYIRRHFATLSSHMLSALLHSR